MKIVVTPDARQQSGGRWRKLDGEGNTVWLILLNSALYSVSSLRGFVVYIAS